MIRTRDFFLFLLVLGFLIVAIVVTLVWSAQLRGGQGDSVVQFTATTATYTAAVAPMADTKDERLAALRKKLAEDTSINAPDTPTEPENPDTASSSAATEEIPVLTTKDTVQLCTAAYTAKSIPGLNGQQQYEEREGQRMFFTMVSALDLATTTPGAPAEKQIVFTLPLRLAPLLTTSCIKDDIVAVSQTGMVIRNTEYAIYRGNGESTLIGYTLDGFPLYGRTNSITTDACGGAIVDGSYRYYLSAERDAVLGCFAGIPAAL